MGLFDQFTWDLDGPSSLDLAPGLSTRSVNGPMAQPPQASQPGVGSTAQMIAANPPLENPSGLGQGDDSFARLDAAPPANTKPKLQGLERAINSGGLNVPPEQQNLMDRFANAMLNWKLQWDGDSRHAAQDPMPEGLTDGEPSSSEHDGPAPVS